MHSSQNCDIRVRDRPHPPGRCPCPMFDMQSTMPPRWALLWQILARRGWDGMPRQKRLSNIPRCLSMSTPSRRPPRKYGFHGTLKPPFRLARGTTEAGLRAAIQDLASGIRAFEASPLVLRRLDRFLALVPSSRCEPLSDLAAACVQGLDAFRAPPTEGEIARRQASGLTPEQNAFLERWGYPYVLGAFRFHLTLTGALKAAVLDEAEDCLKPLTASFAQQPMAVHEICLFQQIDGAPFRVLHRYALAG